MFYSCTEHISIQSYLNDLFHELSSGFFCWFDNYKVNIYALEFFALLVDLRCNFLRVFEDVENSHFW
jgi:hypothetical protein